MNHRFMPILILSLFALCPFVLGASSSLYMMSLFANESITSTSPYGTRITIGFGQDAVQGTMSFRMQHPQSNVTLHVANRVHGHKGLLTGSLLANLAYFSHAQDNGATSLTAAYVLSASTPSKEWPTLLRVGVGAHVTNFWSNSYDKSLWSIAPHISLSLSQTFFDRLGMNLFTTTDTLCMQESNLSFYYGLSIALAITDNLILQVRPLVRLSDYTNESVFVTLGEVSFSICRTDSSTRKQTMQDLGVWL
ncbi:MAG: hypothetical protein JEY71_15725 [Sphaerochaeta sp.]|nr:hypothetical protein [Sphaerochaeta sp.]